MINITSINFDKLEKVARGGFGVVYRDGDHAIKIYHDTVRTGYATDMPNPSLYFNKVKLKRLLQRNKLIENTDLIQDIVCDGDKYVGVVYPYYEGITLDRCKTYPLQTRLDMSRQIVENAKELTDNNIYPLDYKLNNMIYVDDKVKIIDLDDFFTKVKLLKSNKLLKKSSRILDETIKCLLGEYDYYGYVGHDVMCLLNKEHSLNYNYDDISGYLDNKEKSVRFLLVDSNTDIDKIDRGDYLILFINDSLKNKDLLTLIINNDLSLYGVVRSNQLENFLNNYNVEDCIDKTKDKVLSMIN